MKICVVKNASLFKFDSIILPSLKKIDLAVFSYETLPIISYKKEIEGETNYISYFVNLSKKLNALVFVGSKFDLYGKEYHSILAVEKGGILGIVDSVLEERMDQKNEFTFFDTSLGKIGILVNEDLFLNKAVKTRKQKGVDWFIHIGNKKDLQPVNEALSIIKKEEKKPILSLTPTAFIVAKHNEVATDLFFSEYFTKEFKIL